MKKFTIEFGKEGIRVIPEKGFKLTSCKQTVSKMKTKVVIKVEKIK